MTDAEIDTRLRRREWQTAYRGVYLPASSPATPSQAVIAALAASGRNAVASHLSAAWLWGMQPAAPREPWITVPATRRRQIPGVHVAHALHVEVATRDGIPCTSPVRTLIDCASVLRGKPLADLLDRALACRAVRLDDLVRALEPAAGADRRPGRGLLRADLLRRGLAGGPAPSVLESKMLRLMSSCGLPTPECEVRVAGPERYRLDFAWPGCPLAVEVDGYAWHSSPERMANDTRRRNALVRRGFTVLVYTWRDVVEDRGRVGAEIVAAHGGTGPCAAPTATPVPHPPGGRLDNPARAGHPPFPQSESS